MTFAYYIDHIDTHMLAHDDVICHIYIYMSF